MALLGQTAPFGPLVVPRLTWYPTPDLVQLVDLHLRGLSDEEHERLAAISWATGATKNSVALAALRTALGHESAVVAAVQPGQPMTIVIPTSVKHLATDRRAAAHRDAARRIARAKSGKQRADELYATVHQEGPT